MILAFVPCLLPQSMLGFALDRYFSVLSIPRGPIAVAIAHSALIAPLAFAIIREGYARINPVIVQAAQNLGARPDEVGALVMSYISPSLLAATTLGFILSWSEFIIAWYLGGTRPTLSVAIRAATAGAVTPEVFAAGVCSIILVAIAAISTFVILRRTGDHA